jgi:hypothetical protein
MKSLFTILLVILISFSSYSQIITIAEAREDLNGDYVPDRLGDTVTVQGVVFTPNFASTAGVNHYYIYDETAGVHTFCPGPHLFNWNLGDETELTGVVAQFMGAIEIIALDSLSWVLISAGNPLPEPAVLTIGEYLSDPESYEGSLVQLSSVTMAGGFWPGPGVNSLIQVSDGIDTVDLFLDRDTEISQNPVPPWPTDVLAVGAQNTTSDPPNDGYQLYPRFYSDFLITIDVDPEVIPAPHDFILNQNYPNPFNPATNVSFVIGQSSFVSLKVFDILGNEVAVLVNEVKPSGKYEVKWNAVNVPSGVYFYQIKSGGFIQTKKMVLLK